VSAVPDRTPAAAKYHLTVLEAAHLFRPGAPRVRPVLLKVGTGDFALTAAHRLTAISLVAGTLNSAAAFSIAVASSAGSG
jgi:hypothetical protein